MPKQRFVRELPDAYLLCRRYRHQFDITARFQVASGRLLGELAECKRGCHVDRVEVRDKRGQLQWRWYHYPKDYAKPRDQVATNVEELADEIRRRFEYDEAIPSLVTEAMDRRRKAL